MGGYTFGETVVSGEKGNATGGVIIFLHGLGDTGHSWAQNLGQLGLSGVRYVCPTAPTRPVTLNGGMPMPAWFDLPGMGPAMFSNIDWEGVNASAKHVHALIEAEVAKGVPSEKIIVGGFSQGGAVAIRAAMKCERKLAGAVMLSSFVGPADDLKPGKTSAANAKVPLFWGHGDADMMVPMALGQMGSDSLRQLGVPVEFKNYPGMGHSSCPQELADVKVFVLKCLAASTPPPHGR